MSVKPYLAAEDSALLREAAAGYSGGRCLEIGAGNAGLLVSLSQRFSLAVGTDLVRPWMDDWKGGRAGYVLADRAACFGDRSFDLVAFNPPYLATDGVEDPATDGGTGAQAAMGFLREALRVVKREGAVLMLLNQEAPVKGFVEVCRDAGFALRPLLSKRLFYEELTVYEAKAFGADEEFGPRV